MQKTIVFTIAIALAANAQRIETEKSDRHKVIRVETAPNHLSIIELAEPVTEVAAGSSSYKIEWRGNKVFVQPLEPEATTNLFIWTASGRLSYELVPAPSVQQMHFAIDQEAGPNVAKVVIPEKPIEDPQAAREAKLASEMLFASTPVRLAGEAKNHARVEVILKDIYRDGDRIYVRYAIQNGGRSTYVPGTPGVFTLRSPHSSSSLYALSQSQLVGDGIRLTSQGQSPVKVLNTEVHANAVAPGGTTWGLVAFEWPARTNGPAVLKFAFPSDGAGEVSAVLVL
ncbi:MAG: TrbG/VirB9 family P-type conjugative transfer protein [Bryobacteraceae bacterium]